MLWCDNYKRKVDSKLREIHTDYDKLKEKEENELKQAQLILEKEREKDIELENDLKMKTKALDNVIEYHVYNNIINRINYQN